MTAVHEQTPPFWLEALDPDHLQSSLGENVYHRGVAYHRQGQVMRVSIGREGTLLVGMVRGSRRGSYTVIVRLDWPEDPMDLAAAGGIEWSNSCTCPMEGDCKHVAAAILAARKRLLPGAGVLRGPGRLGLAAPARPAWETAFTPLVQAPAVGGPATDTGTPLGLLVQVTTPRKRPGTAGDPALTLRPVIPGTQGGWIRSGIGWRELDYGRGAQTAAPSQREALLAIRQWERSRSGYYYGDHQTIAVAGLGPTFWRLVDDAVAAGVALVSGDRGSTPVRVVTDPVSVVLDLARDASDDLAVRPLVPIPGVDVPIQLIGSPPHGAFARAGGELILAPLAAPLAPALEQLVRAGRDVSVPAEDVDRFLSEYYPLLRQRATVRSTDGSIELPAIPPPRLALQVTFEPSHRTRLLWTFRYAVGEQSVDVPLLRGAGTEVGHGSVVAREAAIEEAMLASLDVLDAVPGMRIPRPGLSRPALVVEPELTGMGTVLFARDVLPVLEERDDVDIAVVGDRLDYVELTEAPVVAVSTHDIEEDVELDDTRDAFSRSEVGEHIEADGAALDWFDLGVSVSVDEQQVPLARLLTALAAREEHLILDDGTWFALDVPQLEALRRLVEEARALQDHPSDTLRINRYQLGLWEELVALGIVTHQSERWSRSVGALLGLETLPIPDPPADLHAELRPYQLDGYHWLALLWDHQLGGILADDMGLGKTLQTLAMTARAHEQGTLTTDAPLLVVAPTSVVAAWTREAARFTPGLRVVAVTETEKRSGMPILESTADAHVVVTSYALFRIDEAGYRRRRWSGLVLDEAQFVKNHRAATYAAVRRLPAPFKLAITGTPLENSLMDLWSLLSISAPGLFPSPQKFSEHFRKPIESGASPELLGTLRQRIRPLMLRRTKEAVAQDLPPKIEQVVTVPLNPQHRRIYDRHLQRERQRILGLLDDVDRNRIAILTALTKLRQLSLDVHLVDAGAPTAVRSSKADALLEQLVEVVSEGHRCLVFSQFTGFLRIVRERLAEEGIEHVYLDGRTRDRPKRIAQFTDGAAPVFVISLKAGGSGLTLTEADYVFVLDPWWNPAVEAQAIDRAHRIGQDKTVMVYRLVSEGTIEEKVIELQDRKRELFARVIDDGGLMGAPLSAADIRGLLGG